VYRGKVGGSVHDVVSVATMEGVWFAFDADTGKPFHERVKVIDRVEHPPLRPGEPVTVFPSSLGGLNYSPASYDPATNYTLGVWITVLELQISIVASLQRVEKGNEKKATNHRCLEENRSEDVVGY
jgi:hypothetical protein